MDYNKARKFSNLSQQEELDLLDKAKLGDSESLDHVLRLSEPTVISIAKSFSKNGIKDDLIQEGRIGILESIDGFEPTLGYRFNTYSPWWIKKNIFKFLTSHHEIYIPTQKRHLVNKINGITESYITQNGAPPNKQYIADKLNETQDKKEYTSLYVKELEEIYNNSIVQSMHDPLNSESEDQHEIYLSDGKGEEGLENSIYSSLKEKVEDTIKELPFKDETPAILEKSLLDNQDLREIASDLEITLEQVRNKHSKGMRALKSYLTKKYPLEDLK